MAKPLERGTKPFSRVRRAQVLRKQLGDLVDGMIGQASENIAWIDEGLHLMQSAYRLGVSRLQRRPALGSNWTTFWGDESAA